jgi:hypothetical protein
MRTSYLHTTYFLNGHKNALIRISSGSARTLQPVFPRPHKAAWLDQVTSSLKTTRTYFTINYMHLLPCTTIYSGLKEYLNYKESFLWGHLKTSTAQYSTEHLKTVFTSPRPFERISEISKTE